MIFSAKRQVVMHGDVEAHSGIDYGFCEYNVGIAHANGQAPDKFWTRMIIAAEFASTRFTTSPDTTLPNL